ncbi:MAG: CopK family periplasmic copper-binding protein [Azoarcus sp.]|nr:CopK family periplasmic copper-binding protein [Azoarcus sp.]
MKFKTVSVLLATAAAFTTLPALADTAASEAAEKTVALADGGTLYVFSDGKMAKANRYGRAEWIKIGTTLKSADGKSLEVTSNEVARLGYLTKVGHEG